MERRTKVRRRWRRLMSQSGQWHSAYAADERRVIKKSSNENDLYVGFPVLGASSDTRSTSTSTSTVEPNAPKDHRMRKSCFRARRPASLLLRRVYKNEIKKKKFKAEDTKLHIQSPVPCASRQGRANRSGKGAKISSTGGMTSKGGGSTQWGTGRPGGQMFDVCSRKTPRKKDDI